MFKYVNMPRLFVYGHILKYFNKQIYCNCRYKQIYCKSRYKLSKQKIIGPFIRNKIRRDLNKTQVCRIKGTKFLCKTRNEDAT